MKHLKRFNENKLRNANYEFRKYTSDEVKAIFSKILNTKLIEEIEYDLTKYDDKGFVTDISASVQIEKGATCVYYNGKWKSTDLVDNMYEYEYFPYDNIIYYIYIVAEEPNRFRETEPIVKDLYKKYRAKYPDYLYNPPSIMSITNEEWNDDNDDIPLDTMDGFGFDIKTSIRNENR